MQLGADGNLIHEFMEIERIMLEQSRTIGSTEYPQGSYQPYVCRVAGKLENLGINHECLDVASPRTLSTSNSENEGIASVWNTSYTTSEGQLLANRFVHSNIMVDINTADTGSMPSEVLNMFGSNVTDEDSDCGISGKTVGDGVINSFDLYVIAAAQFLQGPYSEFAHTPFSAVSTVSGRPDTKDRCCMDNPDCSNFDRLEWQNRVAWKECYSYTRHEDEYSSRTRRLEERDEVAIGSSTLVNAHVFKVPSAVAAPSSLFKVYANSAVTNDRAVINYALSHPNAYTVDAHGARNYNIESPRAATGWSKFGLYDRVNATHANSVDIRASTDWASDFEIVLAAVQQNGLSIVFARSNMTSNFEIALAAVTQNGSAFRYLTTDFANNLEIVSEAVKSNGSMLKFAAGELRNDPVVVLAAVTSYGRALEFASDVLRKNRKIVLAAVENDGWALAFADQCMKNDPEIATIAISENLDAMANVDQTLTENAEFMLAALASRSSHSRVLAWCRQQLLENRDFFLSAVRINGLALEFASDFLKNDSTIVLAAVQSNGMALEFGPGELDDIREIVLVALKQNGFAIQFLHLEEIDREFAMTAVQENGLALQFAGPFINDREVVLAAIQNDPSAFEFANERFREDEAIFLAAVTGDGGWYRIAPTRYQELYSFKIAASTANKNQDFGVASNLMKEIQTRVMGIMPRKPDENNTIELQKTPTELQLEICKEIEEYENDINKIIKLVDKSKKLNDQEREYISNQYNFLVKRLGDSKMNDCQRLIYNTLKNDYTRENSTGAPVH